MDGAGLGSGFTNGLEVLLYHGYVYLEPGGHRLFVLGVASNATPWDGCSLAGAFFASTCERVTFTMSSNASGNFSIISFKWSILLTSSSTCLVRGSIVDKLGAFHLSSSWMVASIKFCLGLMDGNTSSKKW